MAAKEIAGNENEYIAILLKRNEQLAARLEKAADIYRELKKDNNELRDKITKYEELVILYY